MTPTRPVQGSLLPELQPDKPIGRILSSVQHGTNADLIAAVAPLYLQGAVLDVTFGRGLWWRRFRPAVFVHHDLSDGVDFRDLPHADDSFDAVCFDPPYVPQGGASTKARAADYRDAFGLLSRSELALWALIAPGLVECARVVRPGGFVLVKCTDYVASSRLTLGHVKMLVLADSVGLACHDLIVHNTGSGPGGHNIFTPKRARRHHSYLLVFVKPSPKRAAS